MKYVYSGEDKIEVKNIPTDFALTSVKKDCYDHIIINDQYLLNDDFNLTELDKEGIVLFDEDNKAYLCQKEEKEISYAHDVPFPVYEPQFVLTEEGKFSEFTEYPNILTSYPLLDQESHVLGENHFFNGSGCVYFYSEDLLGYPKITKVDYEDEYGNNFINTIFKGWYTVEDIKEGKVFADLTSPDYQGYNFRKHLYEDEKYDYYTTDDKKIVGYDFEAKEYMTLFDYQNESLLSIDKFFYDENTNAHIEATNKQLSTVYYSVKDGEVTKDKEVAFDFQVENIYPINR